TPIGPARQVGVVGRDQEGDAALGLEPCEQIVNDLASLRVEVARGLVGQDQRGTIDEGACDRDPLLLAARQLARAAVHPVGPAGRTTRLAPRSTRTTSGPVRYSFSSSSATTRGSLIVSGSATPGPTAGGLIQARSAPSQREPRARRDRWGCEAAARPTREASLCESA